MVQFKPMKSVCNESEIGDSFDRKFQKEKALTVVVSGLTYVQVGTNWHYICIIIDLYNREIIGYSSGPNKNKELAGQAIAKIRRLLCFIPIEVESFSITRWTRH
ncbi:hypothetical protein CHH77_16815 [Shouchella clausii]|nr:hypothetical protein CHH77_16815 [Shouchella clausii]